MFIESLQYSNIGLFFLRFIIGVIFLVHAMPKFKHPKAMAEGMGMAGMSLMVIILGFVETIAALYLIFGFYTQLGALLLISIMIGAITMKIAKWNVPFSSKTGTGWEFDLILLAASLTIILVGGGTIGIQ